MKIAQRALIVFLATIFSLGLGIATISAQTLSAEEILTRVDANQVYSAIYYEGRMEIVSGARVKVKTMKAWAEGEDKAFIEFTNPEDRGTKMLRLKDELWMYFPSERDTVKISGAMLRQGIMGSDFSYQDAMSSEELSELYTASISGSSSSSWTFVSSRSGRSPEMTHPLPLEKLRILYGAPACPGSTRRHLSHSWQTTGCPRSSSISRW